MKRRWLQLLLAVTVAGVGLAWVRRPAASPEQAVRRVVDDFCRHLAERHPAKALKLISRRFQGDGWAKSDVARGVITLLRDYEQVSIHIADVHVFVARDGQSADADIATSIVAWGDGRVTSVGESRPLHVSAHFEQEGRQWRVVRAENVPVLDYGF